MTVAYEQKDNRGSIWKNERKSKDTDADFTGSIMVDGREYWLNGWKRRPDAKPNAPSLTLSVRLKEGQGARKADPITSGPQNDDMNDDIPF